MFVGKEKRLKLKNKNWQKSLHTSGLIGNILMDLKMYDCLPHDLLIAKLDSTALILVTDYLINHFNG